MSYMAQHKSRIGHKVKHRSNPKDLFYTPVLLAIELIKLVPLFEGDFVLDPAYGNGAFYDNFPSYVKKDFCEIEKGRDFFEWDKKVDWLITNPPYSKLDLWITHSCTLARKGFAYLMGLNNLTAKRLEELSEKGFGLTKIHLFKVYKWWGMSSFFIWEKGKESIVSYNRTVWREDKVKDEKKFKKIDSF